MIYKLLLSSAGFIAGVIIEGVLAIAAIVLIILVLKYGLPKFEKKEPKAKKERPAPQTYALRYVGGEAEGDVPEIEYYAKGAKINLKLNMFATPVGKQFYGWYDGHKKYAPQGKFVMPNQDVTFTAQWAEIPSDKPKTYGLTYVSGGANGSVPALEQYAKGTRITLKSNMFETPQGKQFDGWYDGIKKYQAGNEFEMPEQSVTLTAQWADIPGDKPKTYGLTYVSGGANGSAPALEQYAKGARITLKSNMFETPQGKQFDGWYDGIKKYQAGNEFEMPEQSVTLTAQWKDLPKEEPKKVFEPKTVEVNPEQAEQQLDGGTTPDGRPIIVNVYNTHANTEKTLEKEVIRTVESKEDSDDDDDGLEFADYTILQLYELLTAEQKRYFDKLKDAAMSKPQAKLSVGKKYFNIKIGKRSILKLKIKRLITVGEFSLENDILRDFRKASENKAGNSKIKVRPTMVAVTDEATLETALNMIDLVHKQILES